MDSCLGLRFCLSGVYMSGFILVPECSYYCGSVMCLNTNIIIPPEVFFFRIVLTTRVFYGLHEC